MVLQIGPDERTAGNDSEPAIPGEVERRLREAPRDSLVSSLLRHFGVVEAQAAVAIEVILQERGAAGESQLESVVIRVVDDRSRRGGRVAHDQSSSSSPADAGTNAERTGGGMGEAAPRTDFQTISFSSSSGVRSGSSKFIAADASEP